MTVGSVNGFCERVLLNRVNRRSRRFIALHVFTASCSIQGPLMALILNSPMLGSGFSNFLRIQKFLLQSGHEDSHQRLNGIGAICLGVNGREAATISSEIYEKRRLATENISISVNNLSVRALATEIQVYILDNFSFNIANKSLNIDISPYDREWYQEILKASALDFDIVDENDIITVQAAALMSSTRDKDQKLEEEVVLNLDNESEVLEEEPDTMSTTNKRLYRLLCGTISPYLLITIAVSSTPRKSSTPRISSRLGSR
ncbi:hypothetical protein BOTCAL_0174g00120 [Botryotinia calthae]|uniref:Uncharacterized protein n=1 Tax=Botryotinia calthae TaxID=38488 RepID=A0A4Y8D3C6_9HELO|nr:hypothetical protein BOTCAL_0174g00120 [Botryotinia calthae]